MQYLAKKYTKLIVKILTVFLDYCLRKFIKNMSYVLYY